MVEMGMKRFTGVLAAVFLIFLSLQGLQGIAGDRAYSGNAGVKKAGALPAASKKKAAVKTTGQSKKTPAKSARSEEVPVPRAKPESAPAKKASASTTRSVDKKKAATAIVNFNRSTSETEAQDTATPSTVPTPQAKPDNKTATAETATDTTEDSGGDVPIPRAKQKPAAPVQAGLAPATGDAVNTSAPYRGNLESAEIKTLLSGKVLSSRIDGKDARISLADDGSLSWTSSAGSGTGRWWTEKGRVCDRYDPSGDFPGRGTGCRSFEQKADGYYAGGRKLILLN